MTAIGTALEKLALHIAEAVQDENEKVGLDQKLDAFKALTAYYAAVEKVRAKQPDADDDTGSNFDSFRRRINGASANEPSGEEADDGE